MSLLCSIENIHGLSNDEIDLIQVKNCIYRFELLQHRGKF